VACSLKHLRPTTMKERRSCYGRKRPTHFPLVPSISCFSFSELRSLTTASRRSFCCCNSSILLKVTRCSDITSDELDTLSECVSCDVFLPALVSSHSFSRTWTYMDDKNWINELCQTETHKGIKNLHREPWEWSEYGWYEREITSVNGLSVLLLFPWVSPKNKKKVWHGFLLQNIQTY